MPPQVSRRLWDSSAAWPRAPPSQAWHRKKMREVLWEAGVCVCLLKLPLAYILGQYSDTPTPWHARAHTHISVHTVTHTHNPAELPQNLIYK